MAPMGLAALRTSPARRRVPWHGARRGVALAGALALLLLAGGPSAPGSMAQQALAQEPDGRFLRERLELRQELGAVLPFDLDGDGLEDLVVLEADFGQGRDVAYTLRVLRQGPEGFTALEQATAPLPLHVSLAAMGRFRGGPGLALLTPGQLTLWPWQRGRFAPEAASTLAVQSLFPVPGGELRLGLDWIADLDGDGVSELLVPRFDGLEVVAHDASGRLQRRALLRVRANMQLMDWYRRNLIAYEMPAVFVQQVDGRAWRDIVLFLDGQLWVFLLDDAMEAEGRPAVYRDFQPPRPFDPQEPWDPPMRLVAGEDLNADGHLDLVLTKNAASDSQFNTRTHVLVYYGRAGTEGAPLDYGADPDQVFLTEGFSLPLLLDLDSDGRKDLVLVNVEIGLWNMIKALIQRSMNAQAAFYFMPRTGRYPRDPHRLRSYEVTFSLGRFAHQPIAAFGDLNGDGLPDLLLSVDKDTLGIHWGRRDAVWASGPDARLQDHLPINDSRLHVVDLDGDGRDDLLFLYNRDDIRQMPAVNGSFTVLRSRYGKARIAAGGTGTAAGGTGTAPGGAGTVRAARP